MATLEQIERALRNADAAGDVEAAKQLAQEYKRVKSMQTMPATEQPSIGERALKNLPGDIKNIGQSTIDAVTHPIDTATGMATVARGAMQKAMPNEWADSLIKSGITPEARPQFDQFAEPYKRDFGSLQGFGEAIADHPATTFLNASGIVSGVQGLAKGVFGKTAHDASLNNANRVAKFNKLNAPKRQILADAQKAGYVLPQSEINPGFFNDRLEGIAGKAALNQQSVINNQGVTTALARKALGIPDDVPIDIPTLEALRKQHGQVYAEVSQIPTPPSIAHGYSQNSIRQVSSKNIVEDLKQTRNDMQGWYEAARRSGNPDELKKAKMLDAKAKNLEIELEQRAQMSGNPELVDKLRQARTEIAKTYEVQNALNVASGEVNPVSIGATLNAEKPLTGELKTIGQFQQQFPKYSKAGEKAQTPGVSKVEAMMSLMGGAGGAAAFGPGGSLLGLAPFLSTPIRNMLLSKPYQARFKNMLLKHPNKTLSIMDKAVNQNISPEMFAGLFYQDGGSQ